MATVSVKCLRGLMWVLLTLLVLLAVLVTSLRFFLPQLDQFRQPISLWASRYSEVHIDSRALHGEWHNTGPALSIEGLAITQPGESRPLIAVESIELQLDLWRSLFQFKLVFQEFKLDQVDLDLTQIPALNPHIAVPQPDKATASAQPVKIQQQLEDLFFVQLEHFVLTDSQIWLWRLDGEQQELAIPALKWVNHAEHHHLLEGSVSLPDEPDTHVQIRANIQSPTVGYALTGTVYASANQVAVTPWLPETLDEFTSLEHGEFTGQAWLDLEKGKVSDAVVEIAQAEIHWQGERAPQQLTLNQGVLWAKPTDSGWQLATQGLDFTLNEVPWPTLTFSAALDGSQWQLNLPQLDLATLQPLATLFPSASEVLTTLKPEGRLEDLRLSIGSSGNTNSDKTNFETTSLRYSFSLRDYGSSPWHLLPEVRGLNADVTGDETQGFAQLQLADQTLSYDAVFQAPLLIEDGDVDIRWHHDPSGWGLRSSSVAVATPHLSARGEFRLEFPSQSEPWLAFYAEAKAKDASATWRYLPVPALGDELTQYLSDAIQGGQSKDVRLLWYGSLNQFPYQGGTGIFQTALTLENTRFAFYPGWPELVDTDVELLFENEALFIRSDSAKTLGATAQSIRGDILSLSDAGVLELSMQLQSDGQAVRDYMMQSPLASSVGVALDYVQPQGAVTSTLNLSVPFDPRPVSASGVVSFNNNRVTLTSPALQLTGVSGRLRFDDTRISARDLYGRVFGQPIRLSVDGGEADNGHYQVDVAMSGEMTTAALAGQIGFAKQAALSGEFPWRGNVFVDIGEQVRYTVTGQGDLSQVTSTLPYPLDWQPTDERVLDVLVRGNQSMLSGRISAPELRYQWLSDLTTPKAIMVGSYLGVGNTPWFEGRLTEDRVEVKASFLDGDSWIAAVNEVIATASPSVSSSRNGLTTRDLAWLPEWVNVDLGGLHLGGLNWHQVSAALRRQPELWKLIVSSRELKGQATWPDDQPLRVALDEAYLHFPASNNDGDVTTGYASRPTPPAPTESDRTIMALMPQMDLSVGSAWIQGYRLGSVNGSVRREDNTLLVQQLEVRSGDTLLSLDGHWTLGPRSSETQLVFDITGSNSSDLMGRFSTTGGLEGASFNSYASLEWLGSPWQIHRESLNGEIRSEMGKGVIAKVGGAGRLLGLFSLESILRKMQLDFTGVFDDGLPFNYLTGSGVLENGVLTTDDIAMQTLAGDLRVTGSANLISEKVNAMATFSPDFTSGLPTLTAFAVAPQSALVVFAVSTILSPVVDVFTQVTYDITGPIDNPVVQERSRRQGEFRLKDDDE
uniref:YhdP family protein n=1 Tax=Thaumasiovibrio occultus TaxID=1891184 RepID=UPI000B350F81|nr:YhdP family protein [Thaumasiovibrio occultus]